MFFRIVVDDALLQRSN